MSENDAFNVPMGVRNRNSIIDSVLSSMNSNCPTLCNSLDLNTQHQMMVDFPALSLLQGEHMGVHDMGFTMSDHVGLVGRNSITDPSIQDSHPMRGGENEERFISGSGTPISASSLATLLVSRFSAHSNLTELEPPPPVNPLEVLKTSISNNHYDALTSFNCGYDGILGDMNNKWAFDKFLACSELVGKYPEKVGFHPFQLVENVTQNEWISSNSDNMNSDNPCGSSKFDNELSLSLSTCQPSIVHGTIISDQCSEISCSGVDPHSLNRQFGPKTICNNKNLSLSFGSHRPIQIDQFFSGSRYLRVIQDILAEIANYALENLDPIDYPANVTGTGARNSLSLSCLSGGGYSVLDSDVDGGFCVTQGWEVESKKKQLVALLQVVDEQYNQCLDEIHTVISAFHAATELDPRVHARFVLKTVSALYKNLRERISNQILAMGAYSNNGDCREDEKSFETSFIQKQWALQQLRRKDHQLWRPQRGLPERSVSVLRAWMFQNFLHPYPKDAEKHLLAVKSGLTRSQVSNWFINARVRLWKPMIEEMYAEMNRGERGVGTMKNRQQS